jgi:hypothetical protein
MNFARRPTLSPAGLTGMALLVAATMSLGACNLDISSQAQAQSDWKKDYTLAAGGTLEIRNTNGLIEVDPGDGNQVSVVAERIAKAATDADAQKAAEAIEIKETVSSSGIVLDAKIAMNNLFTGSRTVKFHVRAPKGTVLILSNTNGDINVRNMTGELKLESTNGRIKGMNLEGTTHAETTNGEVDLDYAALGTGGITAETTNGGVIITLAKDLKASVNARVTNGGISAQNLSLETTESSRRRLTGTINGGGPEIRLETTNGAVVLRGK